MRLTLLSWLFLAATVAAWGQTPEPVKAVPKCELTVAKSPTVRGLQLQMTTDELLALFPGSAENPHIKAQLEKAPKPPQYGRTGFDIYPSEYATKAQFEGVGQIGVELFDNRVQSFALRYTDGVTWDSVSELVLRVIGAFRLPGLEVWEVGQFATTDRYLKCSGFSVFVHASLENQASRNSLRVYLDPSDDWKMVRERKEADREKAKRAFKP